MCALRAHINKSIFGKILLRIEKVVKTFSISDKTFPKLVYYCVPLGHTLIKSYIYIYIKVLISNMISRQFIKEFYAFNES